jgi:pimeloyl-ACP methyl ester carboxylesterase
MPPESRYIQAAGRRAHYVEAGEGPVVLLLHGLLHSNRTWRYTVDDLARRGHRAIAPDLMGMGWSERGEGDYSFRGFAAFVRGFLEALGIERLHTLVGHSLGGAVALTLVEETPGLSGRLVLVGSAGLPFELPRSLGLIGSPRLEPLFHLATSRALLRRVLRITAYKRIPVTDAVLEGFSPAIQRTGTYLSLVEIARAFPAASRELAQRLPEIAVPTCVVWGELDPLIPLKAGRIIASLIPGARLEVIEGCGHCPQEESPAEFNRLMGRILAQNGSSKL